MVLQYVAKNVANFLSTYFNQIKEPENSPILPDFRFYCCLFDRKTLHIAIHKCIESCYAFRLRIQCAAFLVCKYFLVKECFQSFTFFFIYKIRSQK